MIALIGFMGVGKTTLGRHLAQALDLPFADLDQLIAQDYQLTIPEFFDSYGEAAFRQAECQQLSSLLNSGTDHVIATGGGIVEYAPSRERLRACRRVIYLKADFETIYARLLADSSQNRPLVNQGDKTSLQARYLARMAYYEQLATEILDANQDLASVLRQVQ